ncbi:MAG TPA: MFS transporter [Terriglobales bacterium]|nr:MFS transporter [Terriglobales bacterium]
MDNRKYKWYVVGMLWSISFFNYADRQSIFSLFPLLQSEMHLTPVQLGLLGSAFAWVYGLCGPFAGTIVDRVRRKTAILGGLNVWSTIAVATALSRSFRQLFSFMAMEGLGETFYFPASMSMISDYHGKATRSRAMGAHQTSVYIGTIAGGFFAGLIGQRYGWRWSFVFFGGLGILLGLVLVRLLREPQRAAADIEDGTMSPEAQVVQRVPLGKCFRMILGTPAALLLMGAFLCANFVALVLLSWMPKFLYDKFHMSVAMAGLSATIFAQLASMVGSPLGGWFADLLRRRMVAGRVMVQGIALFLAAPFVFFCGRANSLAWAMVALTGWGLFKGFYDANIFASVFDVVAPEVRGATAGLMNMVGWMGGGAAPVVIGFVAQHHSASVAISLASFVYAAAGLLLVIALVAFVRTDATHVQGPAKLEA